MGEVETGIVRMISFSNLFVRRLSRGALRQAHATKGVSMDLPTIMFFAACVLVVTGLIEIGRALIARKRAE